MSSGHEKHIEFSSHVQPMFPEPPVRSPRMASEPPAGALRSGDFAAYDRKGVEEFFSAAAEARQRILRQIADVQRRLADAEAVLVEPSSGGDDVSAVRAVLDGQRLLRAEVRANERAVSAIVESAEAEAALILATARAAIASRPPGTVAASPPAAAASVALRYDHGRASNNCSPSASAGRS